MYRRTAAAFVLLALALTALPGCFIFVDEDDDDYIDEPVFINSVPEFDAVDSWWQCDWSEQNQDYFFEFQARVEDFDGPRDVAYVDATIFLADDPDYMIDSFGLIYEDGAIWGGLVWESESDLYCGEAIDVLFEAWDSYGDKAELLLRY
jgi:hypothetical protein